jgi:hypothetical protein
MIATHPDSVSARTQPRSTNVLQRLLAERRPA